MSDLVGLIPAHAGKTSCRSPGWPESAAHPRSRGENHRCVHLRTVASGSSPLTRGKPRANASMSARVGLIPAHAGKTGRRRGRSQQLSAHPRSRGENCFHDRGRSNANGSSPLTRGKRRHRKPTGIKSRLIPAHAGKTRGLPRKWSRFAAHPRSRGENLRYIDRKLTRPGSSPLTRGKRIHHRTATTPSRLIPAHAGKTVELVPVVPGRTAHPRSRGENRTLSLMICISVGSSPLTRGKLPDRGSDRKAGRLIPAHAGKTTRPTSSRTRCPAHPRSRGENGAKMKRALSKVGSSPLTRGKLVDALVALAVGGLIPAHAGKTS